MGGGAFVNEVREIFLGFPGGPEKLKVNCMVLTVKIMFKWYNNVVATLKFRPVRQLNC